MGAARLKWVLVLGWGAAVATGVSAQQSSPPDAFRLALTGDSIITRRLSVYQEPEYLKMIELLRGADVAFTNLEMLFHDYEPYAASESGGTYMRAEPALVKELVWAGFDLVARANNHTGDYGVLGMQLTTRYVSEAGLVQAGVGDSLEAAREARFLETPKGRVALISVASTFPDSSRAGKTRGGVPPRPGLNPLRFNTTQVVTRERLEMLRALLKELGLSAPSSGDSLDAFRQRFVVGEKPDVRTEPHKEDLEEIATVVKNASRLADYVIVTIHAHEGDRNLFVPAQFLVTFARAMVDAGADVFVGHGPHVLRGVEIYKGKPILYSLGDFIFQNETLDRLPSENYEPFGLGPNAHVADWNDQRYDFDRRGFPAQKEIWESVVAVPVWSGKTLRELKLHPITLGFGKPRTVRGRPMLAGPELGKKIIEDVARLSQPFGTRVDFVDGIGIVRIDGAPTN
jgi:poly-gamma-glutamate capsule biosynthesis protein CapA/YwtB (metallophosphatase superfamily)